MNESSNILSNSIEVKQADIRFFMGHRGKGYGYSLAEARTKAKLTAWARLLTSIKPNKAKKMGFNSKKELLEEAMFLMNEESGFKIKNYRYFQAWITKFRKLGREALVTNKFGNANARKLTPLLQDFLIDRYASPIKPSFEKVAVMLNEEFKTQIAVSTIKHFLNRPQNRQVWFEARHGSKAYYDRLDGQVKRKRASYPDALWTIDGTTVQLLKKGLKHDLYVFYVFDANSEKIIGYEIGASETSILVEKTLRLALKSTMKKPYQIHFDGGRAIIAETVQNLMEKTSRVAFKAAAYKPRGKRAEQLVGRIEGFVLRHFKNFKGGNITSPSLERKANPDFIKANIKDLKDHNHVLLQMQLAVKVWNNTSGKRDGLTPTERYAITHKRRVNLEYEELFSLFMTRRKKKVTYTAKGLEVTIEKAVHAYWVLDEDGIGDFAFRLNYQGTKFDIFCDPHDLGVIELHLEGKYIATATTKKEFAEAIADQKEGEATEVKDVREKGKVLRRENQRKREEAREKMQTEGIPELGFLDMHKDALNRFESDLILQELGLNVNATNANANYTEYGDGRDADCSPI